MGRIVSNYVEEIADRTALVSYADCLSHWDIEERDDYAEGKWRRQMVKLSPYQPGAVIKFKPIGGNDVVYGKVWIVLVERRLSGDHILKFKVQRETKAGTWSKLWEYVYPGYIYRGYGEPNG